MMASPSTALCGDYPHRIKTSWLAGKYGLIEEQGRELAVVIQRGKIHFFRCHFSISCSSEIGENEVLKAFQLLQESRVNSRKNARSTSLGRVHLMQQVTVLD